MELKSSRSFNIFQLLEQGPSADQGQWETQSGQYLFQTSGKFHFHPFAFCPCYLPVGGLPGCVCVADPTENVTSKVPAVEAFLIGKVGEDLSLPV